MSPYAWIGLAFSIAFVIVVWVFLSAKDLVWFRCHTCGKIWNTNGEELSNHVQEFPEAEVVICSACAREQIKKRNDYARRN
jgi:hypothetical protein